MELRQFEYFIAIAETGAFSRAAVRLAVGQPVLNRQMKALQQALGAELFLRTGRGIVLSAAGKIFEQHARGVLETTTGRIDVAPNVQVEIDAMPSTLSLVEGGSGYTILS